MNLINIGGHSCASEAAFWTAHTRFGYRRPTTYIIRQGLRGVFQKSKFGQLHFHILISGACTKRRELMGVIGSAAAWPLAAPAQNYPVRIGFCPNCTNAFSRRLGWSALPKLPICIWSDSRIALRIN